ncbi:MAG: peptidase MA family metallohydrolase [Candidatus Aminicenantes bacterium]|nr:peptidase MA family metallohydrolase [Candidatus Aminicenantes bacterium]
MIEDHGYGSRIYVRKRKRFNAWPYLIVIAILTGAWFFFKPPDKTPLIREPVGSETINKRQEPRKIRPAAKSQEPAEPTYPGAENPEDLQQTEDAPPPRNLKGKLADAHQLFLNRDYEKALALYKEFIDLDPEALLYAGLCCYWLEDYNSAYQYLQQTLENNRRNFLARKFMALTCYKLDDLADSLTHAEIALSQVSDFELLTLQNKLKREQKVMDDYGDQQKVHFKVQFSKMEHTGIENTVLDILEEAYRTIGSDFNFYPPASITVILYNEQGFFDVTRAPGWAGGLYDGKIRIPIKDIEGKEELLKRILFHEFTHALVRSITPRCPVWLNEGLAEYFSEDEELLKLGAQLGQLIPLRRLEEGFPSGDIRLVALAYLESYTAVSDLIEKHGLFRIKECLEALGKGEGLSESFRTIFGVAYEEFAAKWGRD